MPNLAAPIKLDVISVEDVECPFPRPKEAPVLRAIRRQRHWRLTGGWPRNREFDSVAPGPMHHLLTLPRQRY
jgi:hypothetical protein